MNQKVTEFLDFVDKLDFTKNSLELRSKVKHQLDIIDLNIANKYSDKVQLQLPDELKIKSNNVKKVQQPYYLQNQHNQDYLKNEQLLTKKFDNLQIQTQAATNQITPDFYIQEKNTQDVHANTKNMQFKETEIPIQAISNAQAHYLKDQHPEFWLQQENEFPESGPNKHIYPQNAINPAVRSQKLTNQKYNQIQYIKTQNVQNLGGITNTLQIMDPSIQQYEKQTQEYPEAFHAFERFDNIKFPNSKSSNFDGNDFKWNPEQNIPGRIQEELLLEQENKFDPFSYVPKSKLNIHPQ